MKELLLALLWRQVRAHGGCGCRGSGYVDCGDHCALVIEGCTPQCAQDCSYQNEDFCPDPPPPAPPGSPPPYTPSSPPPYVNPGCAFDGYWQAQDPPDHYATYAGQCLLEMASRTCVSQYSGMSCSGWFSAGRGCADQCGVLIEYADYAGNHPTAPF